MPKILIVDDDRDVLETVSAVFSIHKMDICTLSGGEDFFDQLALFQPDVIVMDIYLGMHDGRDLCRELKSGHQHNIPVLLYSAGRITAQSLVESRADDFLSKPFDITELVTKVNTLINGTKLRTG